MAKYCKTRKSANKLGRLYYKTGKPCNRGHNSIRFTKTGRCVECDRINKKDRYNNIKQRTPCWADKEKIEEIYNQSKTMGGDYHVDHIIPLHGEFVSGLHVHENLVILHCVENMKKRNNYEVE